MKKYYIFHKPYNVLSQFTKEVPEHITLMDYIDVEKDIYPIGRLDRDSEGLLLLTNDNKFKTNILDPKSKNSKTYWVQVEGAITNTAISDLENGVNIKLKKGSYRTKPSQVKPLSKPEVTERTPPIRERKNIPTSWIQVIITEGKNRQVRKMCAAVGFPCLRLIRVEIKGVSFPSVEVGKFRELSKLELLKLKS